MWRYTCVASGLAYMYKAMLVLECVELDPSFVHPKLEVSFCVVSQEQGMVKLGDRSSFWNLGFTDLARLVGQ